MANESEAKAARLQELQRRQQVLAEYDPEDVEFIRQQIKADLEEGTPLTQLLGLRALGADDEVVDGGIEIAAQMLRQGMPQQAFDFLAGFAQYERYNWKVYRLMAMSEQALKHYDNAENVYRVALTLNDKDGLSHLYLGECLLHQGKKEEGVNEVKRGAELLKDDAQMKLYVQRAEKVLAMQEATEKK